MKKNAVFFFGIYLFVLEIFTSWYYANEGRDDDKNGSTKQLNTESRISSEILEQCSSSFQLGTRNVHHKRKRMTPSMSLPW